MKINHDRVLISDSGGCRGDLLIIRSLGKRNISSTLIGIPEILPGLFSRFRPDRVQCPSAFDDVHGFVNGLRKIVKTRRYSTIYPTTDCSLLPISENRKYLNPYLNLAFPSHESILNVLDKSKILKIANELEIPTPVTFYPRNKTDIVNILPKIRYPVVIKSKWSYVWDKNGKAHFSRPFYVNSASELMSVYSMVEKNFHAPLIQEYVPGYNVSVAVLFDNGEPKAVCVIKVKRSTPATGGTSVLRESIQPNPKLVGYALKLLKNLDWHGVAEVEFRIDERDSIPKLMEVNPRVWASMNVAIESGVDFPYLLYRLAKGEQIRPVFNYKIGVKFRWLNGDFQRLFSILQGDPNIINIQSLNKFKTLVDFNNTFDNDMHYDGFSLFDPLPFFVEQASFSVEMAKRLEKVFRFNRSTNSETGQSQKQHVKQEN